MSHEIKKDRDVPGFYFSSESTQDRILVDWLGVFKYYVWVIWKEINGAINIKAINKLLLK